MLKPKDIKVGMEIFVVNCKKRTVKKDTIHTIQPSELDENYNWINIRCIDKSFYTKDLLQCLNTDSKKDPSCYGIRISSSKTRYYFSLNEKEAYRHLAENVLGYDITSLETEAETIRQDYMNCVDKVGAANKQREKLRLKYSKL